MKRAAAAAPLIYDLPSKRRREESGEGDEKSPIKKPRLQDSDEIVDKTPVLREDIAELESKHIIYPKIYGEFDPNKIVFEDEYFTPEDGGGGIMIYMFYLFDDGQFPLLIQTPNAMFTPTGVKLWKDGKATIIISAGKDWQNNPLIIMFKQIMDAIQERCVEYIFAKKLGNHPNSDKASIANAFTSIMPEDSVNEKTGVKYDPSINVGVKLSGNETSEFMEKISENPPKYNYYLPRAVDKPCGLSAVIEFRWLYKKPGKKGCSFSVKMGLTQARIYPQTNRQNTTCPKGSCVIIPDSV
jgi:hypothetical protein